MKLVKRISYFFVIPIFFLSLGIFIGVWGIRFFYPGSYPGRYSEVPADRADTSEVPENVAVTVSEETLCADTEYVLKETDILRNTSVETSWQIPHDQGEVSGNDESVCGASSAVRARKRFCGFRGIILFQGKSCGSYGLSLSAAKRWLLSGSM